MDDGKFKYQYPLKVRIPGHTDEIHLDEQCWSCNPEYFHKGHNTSEPDENGKCGICHGKGFVLTEAGEAILELVKRHGDRDAAKDS